MMRGSVWVGKSSTPISSDVIAEFSHVTNTCLSTADGEEAERWLFILTFLIVLDLELCVRKLDLLIVRNCVKKV